MLLYRHLEAGHRLGLVNVIFKKMFSQLGKGKQINNHGPLSNRRSSYHYCSIPKYDRMAEGENGVVIVEIENLRLLICHSDLIVVLKTVVKEYVNLLVLPKSSKVISGKTP